MKIPSIFNIVLNDLVNEKIQLEEELERVINLNMNVNDKVNEIRVALEKLALNDLKIGKWNTYMPVDNDENKK